MRPLSGAGQPCLTFTDCDGMSIDNDIMTCQSESGSEDNAATTSAIVACPADGNIPRNVKGILKRNNGASVGRTDNVTSTGGEASSLGNTEESRLFGGQHPIPTARMEIIDVEV